MSEAGTLEETRAQAQARYQAMLDAMPPEKRKAYDRRLKAKKSREDKRRHFMQTLCTIVRSRRELNSPSLRRDATEVQRFRRELDQAQQDLEKICLKKLGEWGPKAIWRDMIEGAYGVKFKGPGHPLVERALQKGEPS